jgi:hypothetical protein
MRKLVIIIALALAAALMVSTAAMANSVFCHLVGDVDDYGGLPGASDQGTAIWDGPDINGLGMDRRSAAEKVATDGAQITDVYSAMDPVSGPNDFTSASVIIPIPAGQLLHDATFVVAMGDFQAGAPYNFGAFNVNFNGIAESFDFTDGFQVTTIRSFVLTPDEIAAANAAGEFICNFDRGTSIDAIAFDWFKLCANLEPVPVPPTAILLGSGLLGLVGLRFRKKQS